MKKIVLGLGCVAFLALLHAGCGGLASDVCQKACDCQPNCDHNSQSICEDDSDDVQSKVDAAGCTKLFTALLECESTCSCKGTELDVSKCKSKADAVQTCLDAHAASIQ